MKTNLFLIPGFGDNCVGEGYEPIKKELLNTYNVVYSDISWKNSSLLDWSDEFSKKYTQSKTAKNIVVGFSYGSSTALYTAPILVPDVLILCSLSPFFKEFLNKLPKTWIKSESKKRLEVFKETSIIKLISNINKSKTEIHLLVGEKELKLWPAMKLAMNQYIKLMNPKSVTIIPKARHRLEENYQKELIKLLKTL